jgi:hypothetical protein
MGLVTHAIAFGLGYALATPEGRARLTGLRDQGAELARRPEVKQVREKAWDAVGDAGLAARNRLAARRAGSSDTGSSGSALSGTAASGTAASGTAASGTAESGTAASGAAATGGTGTGDSPATAAPTPVAVVPTPGAGVTGDSVDDTVLGEVGPENISGTTVAEDTRAVVLGLPDADPELATPPAKRK